MHPVKQTSVNPNRLWLSRAEAALTALPAQPTEALVRGAAVVLFLLLVGAAGVLGARRVSGALVAPLPPAALAVIGILVALSNASVRGMFARKPQQGRGGGRSRPARLLPTGAALAVALALSVPGSGWPGLIGLWAPIFLSGMLALRPVSRPAGKRSSGRLLRFPSRIAALKRSAPDGGVSSESHPNGEPPAGVLQQFTRRQLTDGEEEVSGYMRVPFAEGQRTENVHLAFCPPFAAVPQLSVTQLEGPAARVKTAQLLPYGMRLDMKLAETAVDGTTILLQFRASALVERAAAAPPAMSAGQ